MAESEEERKHALGIFGKFLYFGFFGGFCKLWFLVLVCFYGGSLIVHILSLFAVDGNQTDIFSWIYSLLWYLHLPNRFHHC